MKKINLLLFFFVSCFASCTLSNVYEKNIEIPDFNWDYQFVPEFKVNIDDTSALYNLNVNIRHLDNYPYMNMWLQLHGSNPEGKQQKERIPIYLATKEGKWLGEGLNGVWMVSIPLKRKIKFPHKGSYTFGIEHDMRINPLPAVMNVGLRLEKTR